MTEVQTPFDEAPVDLEVEHPAFEPSYTAGDDSGEFVMVILEEDTPTIDGRRFAPGSVSWRDLPIPLMYKTTNDGPGAGHKGSRVGGAITDVWKDGGKIYGAGHFSAGEDGQLLRELIAEGSLTGVSADVGGATVELDADAESGRETRTITQGKIMMVTCLPGQAFDDSRISVTADGGPLAPPDEWFTNPNLKEPTALTVTQDGRIFGHAFTWGTCHIGVRDRCLAPPHSKSGYRYFAVGQTMTFSNMPTSTGVITMATDHAGITLDASQSKNHYDHTGFQVADVAVGEDSIGGWFSGALRSNLTLEQVRTIRASGVSGDWRSINGSLELVGLLAVNTPGFPVPRANMAGDKSLALVASGAVIPGDCSCDDMKAKFRTLDFAVMDAIVARVEFDNHNHTPGRGHPNAGGGIGIPGVSGPMNILAGIRAFRESRAEKRAKANAAKRPNQNYHETDNHYGDDRSASAPRFPHGIVPNTPNVRTYRSTKAAANWSPDTVPKGAFHKSKSFEKAKAAKAKEQRAKDDALPDSKKGPLMKSLREGDTFQTTGRPEHPRTKYKDWNDGASGHDSNGRPVYAEGDKRPNMKIGDHTLTDKEQAKWNAKMDKAYASEPRPFLQKRGGR